MLLRAREIFISYLLVIIIAAVNNNIGRNFTCRVNFVVVENYMGLCAFFQLVTRWWKIFHLLMTFPFFLDLPIFITFFYFFNAVWMHSGLTITHNLYCKKCVWGDLFHNKWLYYWFVTFGFCFNCFQEFSIVVNCCYSFCFFFFIISNIFYSKVIFTVTVNNNHRCDFAGCELLLAVVLISWENLICKLIVFPKSNFCLNCKSKKFNSTLY